jgi:GT2 family glycosyltransferase
MPDNLNQASKAVLSIIIISYNTKEVTRNCLESIYKNKTDRFEIIIVDNNSKDGSVEMLCEYERTKKNLFLMKSDKNLGFAKANNLASKKASGQYFLFINSDIVVLNDSINKLLDFYIKNQGKISFIGGKLFNKDMTSQPSCGPFYSLHVIAGALFFKGDYWGLTRCSPDSLKKVGWVSGACILTSRQIFDEIKGFDENIFMYMDEVDMLFRANRKGYFTYFYPEAKFIHLGSASSQGKTYPILQVYRGFIYFYKKHHNNRLSIFLLYFMLKLKAVVSQIIGKLTNNNYLIKTYEEAEKLI